MRLVRPSLRILAAATLLAAAACHGDSAVATHGLTINPTFGGFSADPAAADFSSADAGTAAGTIRVHGTMKLPAPCYDMSARVDTNNQFVMFYVVAERRAGTCTAQVTQVSYDVLISGATAGSHTVVVRHETDEAFSSTVVDVASTSLVVN